MSTREKVYLKFGEVAETAQSFETALGTVLWCIHGLKKGWHHEPDPNAARKLLDQIERKHTLGKVLGGIKDIVSLNEDIDGVFQKGLSARNRLFHGFFERHDKNLDTEEGLDAVLNDLDQITKDLAPAWHYAVFIAKGLFEFIEEGKTRQ